MMKIATKQTRSAAFLAIVSLAAGHPNLAPEQKGEPCPFLEENKNQDEYLRSGQGWKQAPMRSLAERSGDGGVPDGGFAAVKQDLITLLTDSQDFWPGDFAGTPHGPNYGGLFIRLAWHCSGSYRNSDGRGGCDGGRIRHDPEINWPDNGNLDMALKLLEPIKEKYGEKLSWGDLIILSGTAAIEGMGGKTIGFCGGRIDDADGSNSLKLGPSPEQEEIAPCQNLMPSMQGRCLAVEGTALGPTTVGLIYVNPEGPVNAKDDPVASGADIRQAFGRMGFDDRTSVALIGGGHAFGKTHGACMITAENPVCGEGTDMAGKGIYTVTSGFEGAWTVRPTTWSNDYFNNLFNYQWNLTSSPAGNSQWEPLNADGTKGPDIMMLTADLALARDDEYKPISQEYAADIAALEDDFGEAWYRLTTADMGPQVRCIGDEVPEPRDFQNPLPASPETLPDYVPIRSAVQALVDQDESNADGFINLAYRAASTFRITDYQGGVNGARIRFEPESSWPENAGTSDSLALLASIQENPGASMADMIVLAGITALESKYQELDLAFCGGYVDATSGSRAFLAPRLYATPLITVQDDLIVKGLTMEQGVALSGRLNLSSQYYKDLLAGNGDFTDDEKVFLDGGAFQAIVEDFAANEEKLMTTFAEAWIKIMTQDRFLNNRENACKSVSVTTTTKSDKTGGSSGASSLMFAGSAAAASMSVALLL